MTKDQWNNLKVGDRVLCVYDGCGSARARNGCKATVSQVEKYEISVSWDDGSKEFKNGWIKPSSFDLFSSQQENLLSGGAVL